MTLATAEQLHAALCAWLDAALAAGHTAVLVLDPSGLGADAIPRSLLPAQAVVNLITHQVDAIDRASPLAIDLAVAARQAYFTSTLRRLCNRALTANVLSVLHTPLAFDQVVQRLHARVDVRLPDDYAVILRYFDTRMLAPIVDTLMPAQRAAFVGLAADWRYTDRGGVLTALPHVLFQAEEQLAYPLVLSRAQEAALLAASEPDTMVDVLLQQNNQLLTALTPPERYARIRAAMAAAQAVGLTDMNDLIQFCRFDLELGSAFYRAPFWAPIWHAVASGKTPLAHALQEGK